MMKNAKCFQPLIIIIKRSILYVAVAPDPPLVKPVELSEFASFIDTNVVDRWLAHSKSTSKMRLAFD